MIQVVRVQRLDFLHAGVAQLLDHAFGQFVVGVGQDFTGIRIDDVLRKHAAQQIVFRHADQLGAGSIQVTDVLGVDALVLLDDDLAVLVRDIEASDFTAQTLGHEFHQCAFGLEREVVEHEEVRQDLFRRQADRLQQDRHRHLAAAVNAEVQDVLRVEFEVQPRAAVRDDACGEQQLARAVRLALVVLEEHTRRTMQLGHDHTFRTVDHERAGGGHERNLAHVDFLLLDLLDLGGVLAVVDDQAYFCAQRRVEGQTTLLTFLDVKRRVGQVVRHELHACQTIVRHDGENGVERRLQTFALALCNRSVLLQELGIRLNLGGKQEGNLMNRCAFRETLANTLLLGKAVRHGISESSQVRATDLRR